MALTLLFSLGELSYGLEIDAIQEIVEDQVLHYVPGACGVLTGAINFHGRVLPVIDLPALLGFPEAKRSARWLVLSPAQNSLVLTVSEVKRIVALDLSTLQRPPASLAGKAVRGVIEHDSQQINLFDTLAICAQLEDLQP